MKFWFTKKSPKDVYDGRVPYDATVEQVLRAVREVNAAPIETDPDLFDFSKAFQSEPEITPPPIVEAAPTTAELPEAASTKPVVSPPASTRPRVPPSMREEIEQRLADYRAFQTKLNDEREARIRRTMDDVRAKLKQSATQKPLH